MLTGTSPCVRGSFAKETVDRTGDTGSENANEYPSVCPTSEAVPRAEGTGPVAVMVVECK